MDEEKDFTFSTFAAKALKRLREKKTRKTEILYIPSIDENIKIQSLLYPEIVECTEIETTDDPNAADKYAVYLSVIDPDLRQLAVQWKEQGEIREYTDVVDIFDIDEITQIAMEIMKISGVSGNKKVTVVEELKN
jgi:hypothetical protein